jgi:DNA-binding transcriptional LysR family regulator
VEEVLNLVVKPGNHRLDERMPSPLSIKELDLVSLRLFAAAVEEGSLARTADREHVAISAVSRRISDLEARSGVTLLERYDRGVRPTPAGALLAEHVGKLQLTLERMILDMEAIRGGTSGQIRVHAHMSAASGLLPEKIVQFLVKNPHIHIFLEEFTSLEVLHSVRTGLADLGLVSGTVECSDLYLIPWIHDELVVVLKNGHPLLKKDGLAFSDLLNEPFIGMQQDSALLTLYRHQARALGHALNERAHATSFESVRKMVSVGMGIAILPAIAAYPHVELLEIQVRQLRETWAHRPLMLCVRDPDRLSASTKKLICWLTEKSL